MFDLVNGLPVHPLVVHAVVVLVPLTALGTIAIALRPRWRSTHGPLVVLAGIVSAVLCPVATTSGEALAQRVGSPGEHAELGDQLVWFVVPLAVLALALVLLERRRTSTRAASPVVRALVAGLAVVAALATCLQVYRVGDSGASAVWGGLVSSSGERLSDDPGSDG